MKIYQALLFGLGVIVGILVSNLVGGVAPDHGGQGPGGPALSDASPHPALARAQPEERCTPLPIPPFGPDGGIRPSAAEPEPVLLQAIKMNDADAIRRHAAALRQRGDKLAYARFLSRLPADLDAGRELLVEALHADPSSEHRDAASLKILVQAAEAMHQKIPANAEIASVLADALQDTDEAGKAIDALRLTLGYDQFNPYLNYRLGMLYQSQGDEANAAMYLNIAATASVDYRALIQRNLQEHRVGEP